MISDPMCIQGGYDLFRAARPVVHKLQKLGIFEPWLDWCSDFGDFSPQGHGAPTIEVGGRDKTMSAIIMVVNESFSAFAVARFER